MNHASLFYKYIENVKVSILCIPRDESMFNDNSQIYEAWELHYHIQNENILDSTISLIGTY